MSRHVCALTIGALFLGAMLAACQAAPVEDAGSERPQVNYEGMATVESRRFDIAQVRPKTDFSVYSRIQLATPEIAYRRPDRAKREFPLSQDQRNSFSKLVSEAFEKEFSKLQRLQAADAPGPETLTLVVRVQDISARIESRSVGRAGRAAAAMETAAEAIIVIELRDSQSNEILARGVDAGATRGAALRGTDGKPLTRFESAEKVVEKWAAKARAGLETLLDERG
jgi:hypothetical protein